MERIPPVKIQYDFPGLTVLVQKQGENELVAVLEGFNIPDNIPNQERDGFTLIRPIANIVLYDKTDVGRRYPIATFDPPIEIRVGYTPSDLEQGKCEFWQLKLAYWDAVHNHWVIISEQPSNEYLIFPPSTGLVAEAKIWDWIGDPPLAWGR